MGENHHGFCVWTTTYTKEERRYLEKLTEFYVNELVRLHGVPISIILDRDSKFSPIFWEKLHEALGTWLNFCTTFHPQTDGKFEQVIQVLEDLLRSCVKS
ncbi:DNA/RNA polymerase superfamily protein [Gossypium australe]|uniref:DNA/RNA polymerase superfamily protein n=1 Tax=Gossypium australe TaxID=47621 RepID=A0A5B6UTW2_9ROSI|nr:DNA/RNA polymerase superfamily protein [Gossypium australe]